MREDDEQFRHYVPLLRRIIILAAVITAVPVILWTITAFVHSYVGPPKLPTFRPLAAASTDASAGGGTVAAPPVPAPAAVQQTIPPDHAPATVEARATTTDARDYSPAAKGPLLADRAADADAAASAAAMPSVAATTPAPPATSPDSKTADATAAPATPDTATPSTGAVAAQQQPPSTTDSAADTLPAAAPLTGPIPLPRHRPRNFAMADSGVPMPRPRPESASEGAAEAKGGALDWLRNIFQPAQQP